MISLEDNVGDIIGKAQRGLGISDSELAKKAGVDLQTIREWRPERIDERDGFAQFNTRYHDMTVNAYLVWDPASGVAAAFDTGADCSDMARVDNRHKLNVQLILLTHAHPDHVADLPRLREETGADVFVPAREPVSGAEAIDEGKHFHLGNLEIDTRLTWGH